MTSTVPLSYESMESQRGPFRVVRDDDLAMTTRDGVVLRADAYRPEAPGPYPSADPPPVHIDPAIASAAAFPVGTIPDRSAIPLPNW